MWFVFSCAECFIQVGALDICENLHVSKCYSKLYTLGREKGTVSFLHAERGGRLGASGCGCGWHCVYSKLERALPPRQRNTPHAARNRNRLRGRTESFCGSPLGFVIDEGILTVWGLPGHPEGL